MQRAVADPHEPDLSIRAPNAEALCGSEGDHERCPVYDTEEKTWRHLDFFQHEAYLSARVPRVSCPAHGVRQVRLPWARQGSGFTPLFEALVMALCKEMPVRALAALICEHDTPDTHEELGTADVPSTRQAPTLGLPVGAELRGLRSSVESAGGAARAAPLTWSRPLTVGRAGRNPTTYAPGPSDRSPSRLGPAARLTPSEVRAP